MQLLNYTLLESKIIKAKQKSKGSISSISCGESLRNIKSSNYLCNYQIMHTAVCYWFLKKSVSRTPAAQVSLKSRIFSDLIPVICSIF